MFSGSDWLRHSQGAKRKLNANSHEFAGITGPVEHAVLLCVDRLVESEVRSS